MNLKLKEGETYTNIYGYEHGEFVAFINNVNIDPYNKIFNANISLYKSLVDKENNMRSEGSKSYNIDKAQYDTVMAAIENKIRTNSMTFEQALYILLLTRPLWANWELQI